MRPARLWHWRITDSAFGCGALPNFVALQQEDGAFQGVARGTADRPAIDRTVFFALSLHRQKPPLPVRDFLYSAFTAEGGFSSGLEDSLADLEYTAYGLLLIGLM